MAKDDNEKVDPDESRRSKEKTEQENEGSLRTRPKAPPITDEMREAGEKYKRDHGDK